jgi:hypothetical protein
VIPVISAWRMNLSLGIPRRVVILQLYR